jgi:hypothetical protein
MLVNFNREAKEETDFFEIIPRAIFFATEIPLLDYKGGLVSTPNNFANL